jgi:two-component system, NtrC family, response regulator HydG
MMKEKILIVEDQFIEANNLQMILERAGYNVCSIARSVPEAIEIIELETPNIILLDIHLKGKLTGIDLAKILSKKNIPFVYLSANSNKEILDAAKATRPYGFLVKPFRERDVLVTLDIAHYLHQHSLESSLLKTAAAKKN